MRILLVGAGGVGTAFARIAARRPFAELVVSDYDLTRAQRAAAASDRFRAVRLDARDTDAVAGLLAEYSCDVLMNAADPRFVMPLYNAALRSRVHYLDMAMSLSHPHQDAPYAETGVKLGDNQFAMAGEWEEIGKLALVGIGVEPGLSDIFARHAADELFSEIDEIGVRDGANLTVQGHECAPTFSIWTTIEECLNPPVIWEADRGWFTTPPFSEPEVFHFPAGIGPVECVNVEHEEVLLIPRWVKARRVTFKDGLGEEFIGVLKTLHKLGLDSTEPLRVRGVEVSPRDVVAAALPDPATLGDRMRGKTCAGTLVTGTRKGRGEGAVYLYHVADNERCMREYGHQAVVLQTALNPAAALELQLMHEAALIETHLLHVVEDVAYPARHRHLAQVGGEQRCVDLVGVADRAAVVGIFRPARPTLLHGQHVVRHHCVDQVGATFGAAEMMVVIGGVLAA